MQPMYYIGLDVHKKKISYCVKDGSGNAHYESEVFSYEWTCPIIKDCLRSW